VPSRSFATRENRRRFSVCYVAVLAAGLVASAEIAEAQRTAVDKNGVGGRIETDYNAAEKVTQMRTIGADGKLQQKVEYEYRPGYYVAQKTDTTYWPNGKARRIAHNSFDESSNFTGEFIQVFDESGKQVAGHRLTHDPWTGIYRCAEWESRAQDYRTIQCPGGEEEGGGGKTEAPKKFTYEEVMKHLDAARENARKNGRARYLQPGKPEPPRTGPREVGIVFPVRVRAGERVSGSIVENAGQYVEAPGISVARVSVPFAASGDAAGLSGWRVELQGEEARPADGPITLTVPQSGSDVTVTLREAGDASHSVSQTVHFALVGEKRAASTGSFEGPALCLKGQLCMVNGAFNGDGAKTFAAFEDRQAKIVAESTEAIYVDIPELTEPGGRALFIADEARVIALPITVGNFFIRNSGRELQAGEAAIVFPTLEGFGEIPEQVWRSDAVAHESLARAQQLIPGFQMRKGEREEREARDKDEPEEKGDAEEEEAEGEILLVIKNGSPEQIHLRSSKDEMLLFQLSEEAFRRGDFKYDLVVEAKKAGKIDVKGYVIPLLAPIAGQGFANAAAK